MMYTILDTKSGVFGPLMSFLNDHTAIRSFQEMIISRDEGSLLALYPTDFTLYCIGTFDNENGSIQTLPAPNLIMTGFEASTKAIEEATRRRNLRARLDGVKVEDLPDNPSFGANPELQKDVP